MQVMFKKKNQVIFWLLDQTKTSDGKKNPVRLNKNKNDFM